MARASQLREETDGELLERLRGAKDELFRLRFQRATKQLENPSRIHQVRKDIARIYTILRERELAKQKEQA